MQVIILSPRKVLLAGAVAALLIVGSILGSLALVGFFHAETAQAYGTDGVGAKTWFFAEGYTGPGFDEWILVYNPPENKGGTGVTISPVINMYGNAGPIGFWTVGRCRARAEALRQHQRGRRLLRLRGRRIHRRLRRSTLPLRARHVLRLRGADKRGQPGLRLPGRRERIGGEERCMHRRKNGDLHTARPGLLPGRLRRRGRGRRLPTPPRRGRSRGLDGGERQPGPTTPATCRWTAARDSCIWSRTTAATSATYAPPTG